MSTTKIKLKIYNVVIMLTILTVQTSTQARENIRSIINESTMPNDSELGNPLPLASHWNVGQLPGGYSPEYQVTLLREGHHILPWLLMPKSYKSEMKYYELAFKYFAENGLPISFIDTQWESALTLDEKYYDLPETLNPNVLKRFGGVQKKLSPFGPDHLWKEVGNSKTVGYQFKKLSEWYPNPPLVLFLSNNEHPKLKWYELTESKRFKAMGYSSLTDNQKRKLVGDLWINKYKELFSGMRAGLPNRNWRVKSKFIGYKAFGERTLGKPQSGTWMKRSLYTPGRLEPWFHAWDGTSSSFYATGGSKHTDFTVWSPLIEGMNFYFMRKEAERINPNYWFELVPWDGGEKQKEYYRNEGQTYSPERYEGMVQFGMWLTRPRVVREFRKYDKKIVDTGVFFERLIDSVDRVHKDRILKKFWRKGAILKNTQSANPFQDNIPVEYENVSRWFLLDTNVTPSRPWNEETQIPAFVIGFVLEGEYLVYAYSPLSKIDELIITIPDYGKVKTVSDRSGVFTHIKDGKVNILK